MNLRAFRKRIRFVQIFLVFILAAFLCLIVAMSFASIDEIYYARGVVRPADEVEVYAPGEGFIKEMLVDEDDFVEKGELLCRLDDWDLQTERVTQENERRDLEAELALQEARIARVEDTALPQWLSFTEVEAQKSDAMVQHRQGVLNMLEVLIQGDLISRLEYDRALLELTQAKAERDLSEKKEEIVGHGYIERAQAEARAQADVLRSKLESLRAKNDLLAGEFLRREVYAPEASTVTLVLASEGESVLRGQDLIHLSASDALALDLFGKERNIDRVVPGLPVQFETEVFSSLREGYCHGTVELVSTDSQFGFESIHGVEVPPAMYYIRARVEDSPIPLKLGSTVRAEITLRRTAIFRVLFNLD
jgi:multidrug resistance efflux pump